MRIRLFSKSQVDHRIGTRGVVRERARASQLKSFPHYHHTNSIIMASSSSSLRLVPGPSTTASTSIDSTSHPIHAGLHDAIRHGQRNMAHQAAVESGSLHPLQPRLEKWDETRDTMKLTLQRNIHGMGAPLRTMMERKVVSYVSSHPLKWQCRLPRRWAPC